MSIVSKEQVTKFRETVKNLLKKEEKKSNDITINITINTHEDVDKIVDLISKGLKERGMKETKDM